MKGQKTSDDPRAWAVWCHYQQALEITSTMALLLQRVRDRFGPVVMEDMVIEASATLYPEEAARAA